MCGGICVVSLNDKYLKKQIEVGRLASENKRNSGRQTCSSVCVATLKINI